MNNQYERTKYDDIINLPHHISPIRPRMTMMERAAQFSPFAALTGYDEAVKETARLTERRIELDEYETAVLDARFHFLMEHLNESPEVAITYFHPDDRKDGGAYLTVTGKVKKFDYFRRCIVMMDRKKIPIEDIVDIVGNSASWI